MARIETCPKCGGRLEKYCGFTRCKKCHHVLGQSRYYNDYNFGRIEPKPMSDEQARHRPTRTLDSHRDELDFKDD